MKKTMSSVLAAAVSGLFLGSVVGCGSEDNASKSETSPAASPAALAIAAKHACKGLNDCKNQGGCKTADHACAGKNECKGKGGCATVAHHSCKGKNACKAQGGCKSGNNGCAGKNDCSGKGGCGVPVKH